MAISGDEQPSVLSSVQTSTESKGNLHRCRLVVAHADRSSKRGGLGNPQDVTSYVVEDSCHDPTVRPTRAPFICSFKNDSRHYLVFIEIHRNVNACRVRWAPDSSVCHYRECCMRNINLFAVLGHTKHALNVGRECASSIPAFKGL